MWESLALILLPFIIPYMKDSSNILQRFRNIRARPFTRTEIMSLYYLLFMVFVQLLAYIRLVWRSESNIYRLTDSRLVVPLDVLRRRVQQLGYLVSDSLWDSLETRQGVLVYQRLGAGPLVDCSWCSMDEANSFFFFSLASTIFPYLSMLAGLSLFLANKTYPIVSMTAGFILETYARSGGFDDYNITSRSSRDLIDIHWLTEHLRRLYFLGVTLSLVINIYWRARFSGQSLDYNSSRKDLSSAVERLRSSNSLQRAILDDEELREHTKTFWKRNQAAAEKLNCTDQMIFAKKSARDRMGNEEAEKRHARSFLELTTLPDSSG